ncbi:hypothetical protein CWO03_22750 [Vibrio splendidus]|nr:hypothetical protein CWO03_22750 [Vibrio splendidus]
MNKLHFVFFRMTILSLFLQGWIISGLRLVNIELSFSVGTPISYALMICLWVFIFFGYKSVPKKVMNYVSILFFIVILYCFKLIFSTFFYGITYNKTILLFILPFSVLLSVFFINKNQYLKLISFIKVLIFVTAFISIFQFIFEPLLPNALIRTPLINVEGVVYHTQSYLGSVSYTKPNGLIAANSIEYSFILLCFIYFLLYVHSEKNYALISSLYLIIFLNASRFSIILSVFLLVLYVNKEFDFSRRMLASFVMILLTTILLNVFWDELQYTVYRILFMGDTAESDSARLDDAILGLQYFEEYWLLGVPGEVMSTLNRVLTDGALILVLLDFGLFVSLAFFLFIFIWPFIGNWKDVKVYNLHIFSMLMFVSIFINSALLSKFVFPLYLLLISLVIMKPKISKG